jgi:5-methylcytosine-specific restriction endonuclease McrA
MAAAFRCDKCGFASFKTEQAFQRHLLTNKHKMNQENVRQDLFQCKKCNKWYCGRSGISHHKKICNFKKPIQLAADSTTTSVQESKPDIRDVRIETMQQQIDECMKEQKKIKEKIAALEHKALTTQPQPQKSRDKRKKINKDVRLQVVSKQGNACGMCKLVLTPYFEVDHIIGLQFGGTDDESNLMALCRECHAKKSIKENQCRERIKEAIQTIVRENIGIDQRVSF